MKQSIIVLFLLLFINQVTYAELSELENKVLSEAITSNSSTKIDEILKSNSTAFKCEKKLFKKNKGCLGQAQADALIKQTLERMPCKDEALISLLNAGAAEKKLTNRYETIQLLQSAYSMKCIKSAKFIIEKGENSGVEETAFSYFDFLINKLKRIIQQEEDGFEVDTNEFLPFNEITKSFAEKSKELCPNMDTKNKDCNLRFGFEKFFKDIDSLDTQMKAKAQQEKRNLEYSNSPQGLKERICYIEQKILTAKAEIKRQRKVGEVSGTVNLSALNEAGNTIVDYEEEKQSLLTIYKNKIGKSFKLKDCGLH